MKKPESSSRQRPPQIKRGNELRAYLRSAGVPSECTTSNFGAMCDHMAAQGYADIRCPRCKARELRRKARAEQSGSTPESGNKRATSRLLRAGWSVEHTRTVVDWIEKNRTQQQWLEDSGCRRCHGTGRVVVRITAAMLNSSEIDAYPTGSSKHGRPPPTTVSTDELERMGAVGNLLARMRERDPEAARAMAAWRSPDGGTILCLMGMTEAGRKLLAGRRREGQTDLAFFRGEHRRRAGDFPDHIRDKLFVRAEEQARDLLDSAAMLWNELVESAAAQREHRRRILARDEARLELGRSDK